MSVIALLSVCLIATGCTSLHPVYIGGVATGGDIPAVNRGDRVVVSLNSGDVKRFRVTSVGRDALYGKGVTVRWSDISHLDVREGSSGKTTVLIGSIVVVAVGALVGLAHLAAKWDD